MILGRNLSKSKFLTAAVSSSTQYYSFSLVPPTHSQQMRGFSSFRLPRFDFRCMRGPDDAVALFQDMVRMRSRPSVVDFTRLLSAVVKMKQYSVALHLFNEILLLRDAPVNHYTFNIAIDCYCKLQRADLGFAILGAFFKRGCEPTVVTFTTLVKGLLLVGRIDDAAQLLRKLMDEQQCRPNVVTYNSMIWGLCNAGRWNEAQHWLKEMVAHQVYPNVVTYTTILQALLSEGRLEDGLSLFKEMKALQVSPNIRTYTILLNGLCSAHRIAEAFSVFHSMEKEKGIIPDIVTYNALIHGLCKDDKFLEAKDLFDELPSKGLQPDVATYTILIGALCRQGQMDEAQDLLLQMVKNRCLPDHWTYNVFLQGLVKRNKIEKAMHLLEEINSIGFTPTFSFMIQPLEMEKEGIDSVLFDKLSQLVPN